MSIDVERAYRDYGDIVYRRARTLVGEEEAMDVVQELFVSLLRNPGQYKGTSKLSTFLYGATTHACWNRLRNRRNRHRLHEEKIKRGERDNRPVAEAGAGVGESGWVLSG